MCPAGPNCHSSCCCNAPCNHPRKHPASCWCKESTPQLESLTLKAQHTAPMPSPAAEHTTLNNQGANSESKHCNSKPNPTPCVHIMSGLTQQSTHAQEVHPHDSQFVRYPMANTAKASLPFFALAQCAVPPCRHLCTTHWGTQTQKTTQDKHRGLTEAQ
jgi:hypothetical protein